MVAAAKASPSVDSFDFDFGFDSNPPAPTPPAGGKAAESAATASDDPIADLIAADLDSADAEPARPVQPAPRSFGMPAGNAPGARPAPVAPPTFRAPPPAAQPPAAPSQPPAARSDDRFGVAPVFGPAGRSQVNAPGRAPERDPMEEIESLIGEAVRVELTSDKPAPAQATVPVAAAATPAVRSAPIVPPLTTGLPPRRATISEPDDDVPSADEAILAAAAQSGGDAGRLDSVSAEANPFIAAEPSPYKRVKAKPERRSGGMRQYVGMAVAGTLLLAAGFGLYWVLGMGGGSDTEAPVLQADVTPVKEVPPPTPTSTATQQGAVVFNELEGGNATVPADEQLVSRDDSAETSVADVARTVGEGSGAGESELANRKVRTVTVRPDGTIVSGDDAVAGNEELPVDRPNVPEIAGAEVQPSELLAAIPSDTTAAAVQAPLTTDTTSLAALDPTDVGQPAAVNPNVVAPVPVARPTNRAALSSGTASQTATTQPASQAQQPAAAAPVASGSGPYVQLSSQPNQNAAQSALNTTQSRLSNLLAGRSLAIRSVDLGARGTWYRVVLPVDSFQEATQTCASLKANGVDCVPIGG